VGEGGGPADLFPGLGGAHLVRSGGVWGPVTGPRPEVSPRTGHTDKRVSRCGSA
jgi:hypothetical protein